jgi:ACS family tartrate transporter-like MFS transporter
MHSDTLAPAPKPEAHETSALLTRIGWRILPLLTLLYFVAYLDRINIGFAAVGMQRDLGFSDALYGTGAGLFFVGALLAQLPATLLLAKFGARRTLCALMVCWGTISGAMAFVHGPTPFLILRFLLGAAEAGFYPGVILYLTLWLPRRVRTSFTAWFLFAIPMASIFGGPLSSWILTRGGAGRFADWQLLLLCEAIPALVLGSLLPWLMSDSPTTASWLADPDRDLLAQARREDDPPVTDADSTPSSFFRPQPIIHVLLFATVYFTMQFALYAQSFWLPRILRDAGVTGSAIGWHVSIVYLIAAAGMLLWGKVSDHAPTSRWTLTVPLLAGCIGYAAAAFATQTAALHIPLLLAAFGLGAAGALAATPPFWAQVTLGQRASFVAIFIATVNVLGNIGGFAGPAILGRVRQGTGNFSAGMYTAAIGILCGVLLLLLRPRRTPSV